jgi:CheY-like chemotaxis protein
LRILLVEDHPVNQKLAMTLLQRMGYAADLAKDGQQAVEAVAATPYALVLMDMQMPVMDGIEATRIIRASGAKLPIVALSANAMQSDQDACRAAGMDDFLGKPFSRADLAACLERWTKAA